MRFRELPRRTRIIALAGAAVLVVLIAVGIFGLVRGPAPAPTAPTRTPAVEAPLGVEPTIEPSSEPVTFARRVAAALFDWSTIGSTPEQITDAVLAAAEPGGEDVPGLYADIARYLPTAAQWSQLREYDTSQRLEVEDAFVPEAWEAVSRAGGDSLPDGAVAVTIDGIRVRTGEWLDQPAEHTSPVSFTVFLLCPTDASDGCMMLRLSEPGKSLR